MSIHGERWSAKLEVSASICDYDLLAKVVGACSQVCSVLLHQHSPSCQILCCKAINLLVTHIFGPHAKAAAKDLEKQMGKASADLLASPIHWADRGSMEMHLQHLATSALAKLPT